MWETLPIQRSAGSPHNLIDRDFEYPKSSSVNVSRWKDAPATTKEWATSIWYDEFKVRRNFMSDDDLFIWIPHIATLIAKHGKWIGDSKSFYAVYVSCNFVVPSERGKGLSGQMILTMANEATKIWGPIPFMFELHNVPRGLANVEPFLRFTYLWIPFVDVRVPPRWTPTTLESIKDYPGFHVDSMKGYRAFSYDGQMILFDPLNDIVYYTDALVLHTFDGFPASGAWCRFFCTWGSTRIYLHNMYFDPLPSMKHYLLT
jgi:hypothetical protein